MKSFKRERERRATFLFFFTLEFFASARLGKFFTCVTSVLSSRIFFCSSALQELAVFHALDLLLLGATVFFIPAS